MDIYKKYKLNKITGYDAHWLLLDTTSLIDHRKYLMKIQPINNDNKELDMYMKILNIVNDNKDLLSNYITLIEFTVISPMDLPYFQSDVKLPLFENEKNILIIVSENPEYFLTDKLQDIKPYMLFQLYYIILMLTSMNILTLDCLDDENVAIFSGKTDIMYKIIDKYYKIPLGYNNVKLINYGCNIEKNTNMDIFNISHKTIYNLLKPLLKKINTQNSVIYLTNINEKIPAVFALKYYAEKYMTDFVSSKYLVKYEMYGSSLLCMYKM